MVTHYCGQHSQIRIMDKYWHLLSMDPEIGPLVSDKPAITYGRAKSLEDQLVYGEFKGREQERIHANTLALSAVVVATIANS